MKSNQQSILRKRINFKICPKGSQITLYKENYYKHRKLCSCMSETLEKNMCFELKYKVLKI